MGWARALSACPSETGNDPSDPFDDPCTSTDENVGGWSGWIRFDHGQSGYEVYIDNNPDGDDFAEFHNFAWGSGENANSGVVGWISFNCQEGGSNICSTSSYKVVLDLTSINQKPVATNTSEYIDCCAWGSSPQVAPGVIIRLSWEYYDPDNDDQEAFQLWISDGTNSAVSEIVTSSATTTLLDLDKFGTWKNTQCFHSSTFGYGLCTSTTYYWKVKVKDERGMWSNWSATDTFTMPSHSYPYVNFNWIPQKPSMGELVQFCSISTGTCSTVIDSANESKCYNSSCVSFSWTFQNATPSFSNFENPTTTFTSIASSTITLKITDSSNASCTKSVELRPTLPLPKWKEVSPTSFFEGETLAFLTNPLKFIKIHLTSFFGKLKLKL